MLARNAFLALIPRPYYRTSVQRHIRCCSVLLSNQKKNENPFQLPETLMKRKLALENKFKYHFPRTAEVVFRVRDGFTSVLYDTKDLIVLQTGVMRGTKNAGDLNLRELEVLYETFLQVKRMIPLFFIFAIPVFGNFIVAYLAFTKPTRYLSPHFLTDQQKLSHAKEEHADRLSVFLPIIKYLEKNAPQYDKSASKFRNMLKSVQSGQFPNLSELAACKEMFRGDQILSFEQLTQHQLNNLLTLHRQRALLFKTFYLREWSSYIQLVDRFIKRNGVSKLTSEQLRKFCYQRGVNANAMTEKEMCNYLNQWVAFSEQIPDDGISLLLHAPAIIGYSHKSNFKVTRDSSL